MRPTTALALAGSSLCLALTAPVGAQPRPDDNYSYVLESDNLVGETLGTTPPLLRVPPKGRRVLLLRPRVAFVAELLKSVEAL
jgi:hypothetical protein